MPDSQSSKKRDEPVKYENTEEKDVIQDTIENPQNLLPKEEGQKPQLKGGGADGTANGEQVVPNSKLAVQGVPQLIPAAGDQFNLYSNTWGSLRKPTRRHY